MSLKKCKECGQQISSEAEKCPHCGAKLRRSAWRLMRWPVSVLGAVMGGALTAGIWYACELPEQYIWAGALIGIVAGGIISFVMHRVVTVVIGFIAVGLILFCLLNYFVPFGNHVNEQIKTLAEKHARKSLKGTPIVYKEIYGVKKDSPSDDYTVAVLVGIPDHNDIILTLKVENFEDKYVIGWDTKSATILTFHKMDEEMSE